MKKNSRPSKKLMLATETVRELAADLLVVAVGAQKPTSAHFTCQYGCTNDYFCGTTRTW